MEKQPLGGTETAIIRLAEALDSLGQDVSVISLLASSPSSHPSYISIQEASKLKEVDALIVIRGMRGFKYPFPAKKRFYWTGDSYDCFGSIGLGDKRYMALLDGFFAVSEWHAETVCNTSGFPRQKTFILRNGIRLQENFAGEEKRRRRNVSSMHGSRERSLIHLPEIYLELKRRHSDAELLVLNTTAVYRAIWPPINLPQETKPC